MTADTLVANKFNTSYDGSKHVIIWYDEGATWREASPDANRSPKATRNAFRQFAGPKGKNESIYAHLLQCYYLTCFSANEEEVSRTQKNSANYDHTERPTLINSAHQEEAHGGLGDLRF